MGISTPGLGNGALAMDRLGDNFNQQVRPLTSALGISYTIQPTRGVALQVSYTIQRIYGAPLLVYYLISPPQHFALNGDSTIIAPDQVTYTPRPVVARTLLASPVVQGYRTMTWTWSALQLSEYNQLLSFYNPLSPIVTVTYPDEYGTWNQRPLRLLPPVYGTRETVAVSGVSFTFSGIL